MKWNRFIILCMVMIMAVVGAVVFPIIKADRTKQMNPSGITADCDGITVTLKWGNAENTKYYRVYKKKIGDNDYKFLRDVKKCEYKDTKIEQGINYKYKVCAVGKNGISTGVEIEPAMMAVTKDKTKSAGSRVQKVCAVPVMMYHDCVTQRDLDEGILFDEYAVWYKEFEEDLIYLRDNGYTTVTTQQLIDFMEGKGELPEKPVLLTIDDGKLGVYRNMFPLLKKYDMTASLAVIGEEIDIADSGVQTKETLQAPFCTWSQISEMSASGSVEIISHSYYLHAYHRNNRTGADAIAGEKEKEFLRIATQDWLQMEKKFTEFTGTSNRTLAYPYSVRSAESDKVWLQCGYKLLLAGNDENVSKTMSNNIVYGAGCTTESAVLRRLPRMTQTSIEQYLSEAEANENEQ